MQFQSTPSEGRATALPAAHFLLALISIHALRGEGDYTTLPSYRGTLTISIHALRGEGDQAATLDYIDNPISIHALRGEGDEGEDAFTLGQAHFNPRPPRGGRPQWQHW